MTQSSNASGYQPPPLKISRTFHAQREAVFKAWSTAEHVKNWFSPQTYSVPEATVDMRVDYLRLASGTALTTVGTIVKIGRTIGVVDISMRDDQDRLVAIGRATYVTMQV